MPFTITITENDVTRYTQTSDTLDLVGTIQAISKVPLPKPPKKRRSDAGKPRAQKAGDFKNWDKVETQP